MTERQSKLIENYVRTKVRSMLKEGINESLAKDLQKLSTKYGIIFGDATVYLKKSNYPPIYSFETTSRGLKLIADFEV